MRAFKTRGCLKRKFDDKEIQYIETDLSMKLYIVFLIDFELLFRQPQQSPYNPGRPRGLGVFYGQAICSNNISAR